MPDRRFINAEYVSVWFGLEFVSECVLDAGTGEIVAVKPIDALPAYVGCNAPERELVRLSDGRDLPVDESRMRVEMSEPECSPMMDMWV